MTSNKTCVCGHSIDMHLWQSGFCQMWDGARGINVCGCREYRPIDDNKSGKNWMLPTKTTTVADVPLGASTAPTTTTISPHKQEPIS